MYYDPMQFRLGIAVLLWKDSFYRNRWPEHTDIYDWPVLGVLDTATTCNNLTGGPRPVSGAGRCVGATVH